MFQAVLALDDADVETRHVTLISLGMIYYLVRETPREAIPYFEKALSVHPNSTDAHFYLAHIFSKDTGTFADALRHGRAFLALSTRADERRARIEYLVASLEHL
jgi:Tfp pilus assembly protein PilF